MSGNEFKYWAFLSYSRQDNCEQRPGVVASCLCWANWLHEALTDFSVPADFVGHDNARGEIVPDRIEAIFQDETEQRGNASLDANVREALEQSRYLVVICSPRSAQSLHVNEVVRHFKQLGRGNRILPLVIAGEPNASDGDKPGVQPEDECFVPAMRHPVEPDGTLDASRRERGYIFADARHGADKREVLAGDFRGAETELAIAKIQLIAGLIGVGFNGLLRREQKRRFAGFAEAQHLVQEAQQQVQAAQSKYEEAQKQVLALQSQAREALNQLEEARGQVREAQTKMLEIQNLPQDVKSQIQEAQGKAAEAQNQAREAQREIERAQSQAAEAGRQVQDLQNKVRETEARLEEAKRQAQDAASRVSESQAEARNAQSQAEQARNQAREAQAQLEAARLQTRDEHNEPADAQSQIQEAQSQVQALQEQLCAARTQLEQAQGQVRETQSQLAEARDQVRVAESRVLEAQNEVRLAQGKVLETQNLPADVQTQILESQNQAREAQSQIQNFRTQAEQAQSQLEEARRQAREAQQRVSEAQNEAREARIQFEEARNQVRLSEKQIQEIQTRTQDAQGQIEAAKSEARTARTHVQEMQNAAQTARRLTRVFAVMAVLALLAAGTVAGLAWRQRQASNGTPAIAPAAAQADLASSLTNQEQIRLVLQNVGVAVGEQFRRLDILASRIPTNEIPATLKTASVIADEEQRNHFQAQLLGNWVKTDLPGALGWIRQLPDPTSRQRALEKIVPVLGADNPTNALAVLNDLKPAPDERIYTQLFHSWATNDPVQAIEQRQNVPDHDAGDKILSAILTVWGNQQPGAALNWLQSQTNSDLAATWRNTMIAGLFDGWAAKDLEAATAACNQLPDGAAKEKAWECVVTRRIAAAPASAAALVTNLPSGDFRLGAVVDLSRHWAETNVPAALAWAQSLPAEAEQGAAMNQIVAVWARDDATAAAQFAGQHPELADATLGKIAAAWAKTDLNATTNWIARLPEGDKRNAALTGVSASWAQQDPKGMTAYALGLPAGEIQTRLLSAACRQLAVQDFSGMAQLLQSLPDAGLRQTILEQAARDCDLPRLDQAAKAIVALPAGDDQKAAIKGLLSRWASADPEAAADWLRSFPETNTQPEQLQSVIKAWAQAEPAAAAAWLTNSPAESASGELMSAFLDGAVLKYPEFAAQWTQSVTNEMERQKFEVQVARQWLNSDMPAATNWLDHLNLPEAAKQSLKETAP